ncbi:MAG: alpha/beta hydrolase [Salinivirgaceae bacterium]|nr:alpha/beta hydrolase [Salinivirgaceae bacterium]
MKYYAITLLGQSIAYADTSDDKSTILFIHGNSLSSKTFQKQFDDASLNRQFRLIALDMLGYGESDRSKNPEKDYGFYAQADLVVSFIEALKLSEVILVGHSLGGNIAIEVANRCDKVNALALLASPLAEKPMSQEMYLPHPALSYFFTPYLDDNAIAELVRALYKPGTGIPDWNVEVVKKSDPLSRAHLLAPVLSGEYTDQLITLQKMKLPVASIIGEYDLLANPDYIKSTVVETLWQNKVHEIKDGGHMLFYENAPAFNQLLVEFAKHVL